MTSWSASLCIFSISAWTAWFKSSLILQDWLFLFFIFMKLSWQDLLYLASQENRLKPKILHRWHILFCKISENVLRENLPICPYHGCDGAQNICLSSCSRIANLAFSSAGSTSNSAIQAKSKKFKLFIWIFFSNTWLTTPKNNFFQP